MFRNRPMRPDIQGADCRRAVRINVEFPMSELGTCRSPLDHGSASEIGKRNNSKHPFDRRRQSHGARPMNARLVVRLPRFVCHGSSRKGRAAMLTPSACRRFTARHGPVMAGSPGQSGRPRGK